MGHRLMDNRRSAWRSKYFDGVMNGVCNKYLLLVNLFKGEYTYAFINYKYMLRCLIMILPQACVSNFDEANERPCYLPIVLLITIMG